MPTNTFTKEIDEYIITVWMTSLYLWAYTAMGGDAIYRGTVSASNHIDAISEAREKVNTWTIEEVLEREA